MKIKKIIAKNFMHPGKQTFALSEDHILKQGIYNDANDILELNKIFNGTWLDSNMSFEKYYPKFARKLANKEMNLQIDALFFLEEEELTQLNKILKSLGVVKEWKSRSFYYSIKCVYPYIFPIVSLVPAEFKTDKVIGIGSHYEKFFKANLSKRDILTTMGINAVGQLREIYFKYKDVKVKEEEQEDYKRYLEVLKSTFRYDEEFIKKLGQAIYSIDDGDIINYADELEFFIRNNHFDNFLNTIPLLRENKKYREDFATLLFNVYLVDLKWIYSVKTANDIVEIRKIAYENHCEKAVYSRELIEFFKTKLVLNKKNFNYYSGVSKFNAKADPTLVFTNELKYDKIFEKDAVEPKHVEPKFKWNKKRR
ncbi:hypothetical protein [Spiroplasma cantharicola]|uniref:Uncharacterized protein n=1 Tax=Spiroplasma cantharicola TaxID=362837 RepID=A0A0M3SJ98_9MOLU|nr:hypothetical protein [Spiroplasma cantharicola]ALD66378.1 hypothetical protein SCANT_v1c04720 [Spiroplasma cantharicola]